MSIQILIDDRERAITSILEREDVPWWRIARLGVGDYALVLNDDAQSGDSVQKTVMLIERKSYDDFAASIKDGRIDNFSDLINLRESCPSIIIALLVEGARPSVPVGIYKSIRAKINHMRLRDHFHVFESRDVRDTAEILRGLVEDSATLYHAKIGSQTTTGASCCALAPKPRNQIADDVRAMYQQFPGVGAKTANSLIDEGIVIADFLCGKCAPKYARHVRAYEQTRAEALDCTILTSITGVSARIAPIVLALTPEKTLFALCRQTEDQIAQLRVSGRNSASLGRRIFACLHTL